MGSDRAKKTGCLRELLIVGCSLLLLAVCVGAWLLWEYAGPRDVAELKTIASAVASPRGDMLIADFETMGGSSWYVAPPDSDAAPTDIGRAHWVERDIRLILPEAMLWLPGTSSVLVASGATSTKSDPRSGLIRYTLPIGNAHDHLEELPTTNQRGAGSHTVRINVDPLVPNAWRVIYEGGGIERVVLGDESDADSRSTLTELRAPDNRTDEWPKVMPMLTNGAGDSFFAVFAEDEPLTTQRWQPSGEVEEIDPEWSETEKLTWHKCHQLVGTDTFVATTTNRDSLRLQVRVLDRDLRSVSALLGADAPLFIEYVRGDEVYVSCGEGLYRWDHQLLAGAEPAVLPAAAAYDALLRPESVTLIAVRAEGWRSSLRTPPLIYLDERRAIRGATGGPLQIIPLAAP